MNLLYTKNSIFISFKCSTCGNFARLGIIVVAVLDSYLVFWLSIMCNILGGQLDVRLNAFLANCHVVIYIILLLLVISVAYKMMMMMMMMMI